MNNLISILVATVIDALPVLLSGAAIMLVVSLIVFVGTYDSRPPRKLYKGKTWDLVHPTRFMSLE
jgi:hypothetical protein